MSIEMEQLVDRYPGLAEQTFSSSDQSILSDPSVEYFLLTAGANVVEAIATHQGRYQDAAELMFSTHIFETARTNYLAKVYPVDYSIGEDLECPSCLRKTFRFLREVQLRAADESSDIVWRCTSCGLTVKNYHPKR